MFLPVTLEYVLEAAAQIFILLLRLGQKLCKRFVAKHLPNARYHPHQYVVDERPIERQGVCVRTQ